VLLRNTVTHPKTKLRELAVIIANTSQALFVNATDGPIHMNMA